MKIRRAEKKDLQVVDRLLSEVLEIHAAIRPDIFVPGTRKYTDEQLLDIFADDSRPVFVYVNDSDEVQGYAFCIIRETHNENMKPITTVFIDDLCVDEKARGMHVGKSLIAYVEDYAKKIGAHNVTLNVWHGNDKAIGFYRKEGFGIQETVMEKIVG
ncbi:MAG: GNAT family N-acetyltransferase [Solobacterium sp.]|jgi:ribosomal protein S18 acetylase RimI-like enzyme|nr:GNAT family N-acetyltransferase [Solobacterium sp.]MCH4049888.1 GNAT family N-acetyltransferase [Solobacterium sp.]MCH4073573.1 GNAT family N-acetyltransferase [Solobacterium sp.]MCI1312944.1 GNAT family N-acetyltransferase [Solobacterium sp.]MCI1345972.1 GNAT family N-acetyltransferase [Solobacterium sp.]